MFDLISILIKRNGNEKQIESYLEIITMFMEAIRLAFCNT